VLGGVRRARSQSHTQLVSVRPGRVGCVRIQPDAWGESKSAWPRLINQVVDAALNCSGASGSAIGAVVRRFGDWVLQQHPIWWCRCPTNDWRRGGQQSVAAFPIGQVRECLAQLYMWALEDGNDRYRNIGGWRQTSDPRTCCYPSSATLTPTPSMHLQTLACFKALHQRYRNPSVLTGQSPSPPSTPVPDTSYQHSPSPPSYPPQTYSWYSRSAWRSH